MERRAIIKIGTESLVQVYPDAQNLGAMKKRAFHQIAQATTFLQQEGYQVALVSSGAVLTGRVKNRILDRRLASLEQEVIQSKEGLVEIQRQIAGFRLAAACIGQPLLMNLWQSAFGSQLIAQLLLEDSSLEMGMKSVNECMNTTGVVGIVNGNDVLTNLNQSTNSVCVDNDRLARTVAQGVGARIMIMLTQSGGVWDQDKRIISYINPLKQLEIGKFKQTRAGIGGMQSKLHEACGFAQAGGVVLITRTDDLLDCLKSGSGTGTRIYSEAVLETNQDKWVSKFSLASGQAGRTND